MQRHSRDRPTNVQRFGTDEAAARDEGPRLIPLDKPATPAHEENPTINITYRDGQLVPLSGIYKCVQVHAEGEKELLLFRGWHFPRCPRCAESAYRLLHAAPALIDDEDFDSRSTRNQSIVSTMQTKDVEITQDKTGVYVAYCNSCNHVIGVKHTKEELRQAKAAHVCPRKENLEQRRQR
jgi:hypothetical protein